MARLTWLSLFSLVCLLYLLRCHKTRDPCTFCSFLQQVELLNILCWKSWTQMHKRSQPWKENANTHFDGNFAHFPPWWLFYHKDAKGWHLYNILMVTKFWGWGFPYIGRIHTSYIGFSYLYLRYVKIFGGFGSLSIILVSPHMTFKEKSRQILPKYSPTIHVPYQLPAWKPIKINQINHSCR